MKMKKSQKGQALTEFVLALPILCFVILGIVIFGMGFSRYEQVENAAAEGARAAWVWEADGTTTCYQYVVDNINAAVTYPVTVTVSDNCSSTNAWLRISSEDKVTVTVVHDYEPYFIGTMFKGQWEPPLTLPLTASITTRHQ